MSKSQSKPIVLIIRDGWGSNPHPEWNHANAVHLAQTPVDDRLMKEYPHTLIRTCGPDVGLPEGVFGNSEVGHQNIGAGRVVEQELMRITGRIADESFFSNPALVGAFDRAIQTGGRVHLMGLCSDGRVHSDLEHVYALLELARRKKFPGDRVLIHAFTDGRDTLPTRGLEFVREIENRCRKMGVGSVGSVVGRFLAMDRDDRWERTQQAYDLLVHGQGGRFESATQAIESYYDQPADANRTGDEFVAPSIVARDDGSLPTVRDGDSLIFFNYRGDRPRQLTRAFVSDEFPYDGTDKNGETCRMGFDRGPKLDLLFVAMTRYEQDLPVEVAFDKPAKMEQILGAYLSERGLSQFRCAETEKYAHVTFFFNDYRDEPFTGEKRRIVPSPRDVSTYDQKPQMSALELTDLVLERILTGQDDFLVINYANGDMVGHTGNLNAAIEAVETVDRCVGRVVQAVQQRGGGLLVTADHGNCEQMIDPSSGEPHTAHTLYDVECIVADARYRNRSLRSGGRLADLAPTILEMLNLPKPDVMTGESLIQSGQESAGSMTRPTAR